MSVERNSYLQHDGSVSGIHSKREKAEAQRIRVSSVAIERKPKLHCSSLKIVTAVDQDVLVEALGTY